MTPRVIAIIQARMGSSRLPGKVLLDVGGQPMLARVHARTARSRRVAHVVVATTTEASDDAIAAWCGAHDVACTRGSQFDVLDRYYRAARTAQADIVVRITADCPAIDAALVDNVVDVLLGGLAGEGRPFDFVANRLPPPFHRSFPIGLDVEVCTIGALQRAWNEGHDAQHREHVMPFLYEGVKLVPLSPELSVGHSPRGFEVALRNHVPDLGSCRWTVDTPEDLEFMRQVYGHFGAQEDFTWTDLLDLVRREPALAAINAAVQHKSVDDIDERMRRR